ncbi:unnamed protein product, partial [Ilex paraguariensis]
ETFKPLKIREISKHDNINEFNPHSSPLRETSKGEEKRETPPPISRANPIDLKGKQVSVRCEDLEKLTTSIKLEVPRATKE